MRRSEILIGLACVLLPTVGAAAPPRSAAPASPLAGVIATAGAAQTPEGAPGRAAPPTAASPGPVETVDSAPAPVNRTSALGPVRPSATTVGDWALQAAYAVFFLLSAVVMVVAGLGLAIPILGGFALLVILAVTALRRRFAGRSA